MEGIGQILKNTRLEKGLSFSDVEKVTKIRSKYLKAIEDEEFDIIPGRVYLKGFVKTYAKFLDIEENSVVAEFLKQKAHNPIDQKMPSYDIVKPKKFNKQIITIFLGLFAIFLLWGVQSFYHSYMQKNPEISKPVAPKEEQLPITDIEDEEKEESKAPEKEIIEGITLKIQVADVTNGKDACWIRVVADGSLFFEGTIDENNEEIIEAKENIEIVLGNAGAVNLTLNGESLGTAGQLGQRVEREFTLNEIN